jgi:hypothetical protein
MPRPKHYSPAIHRFLVSVLYHEAKARGVAMTKLTNQLLTEKLTGGDGWQKAMMQLQEQSPPYRTE